MTPTPTEARQVLTETVVMRDTERGAIPSGRYVWRGPASDPIFSLANCRDFVSERIDVVVEAPCEAVVICERTKDAPGTIPSTNHTFRHWRIFGNGLAARGFWYRSTIDENNEHGRFDAVSVYGCGTCWRFEGQQSKEHCLTLCRAEVFAYAVAADSGFQWIGGTAASGGIGIALMRAGDPVTIQGVGFETVGVLLHTSGPTTAAQPITLINCRFEADQLAPDGEMIVMRHAGPLVMIGGRYGGGKQPIPRIALRGVGPQTVRLDCVTFGAFGAADSPVIVAQNVNEARVSVDACVMQRGENDQQNTQPAAWVGIQQAVNA